MARPPFDAPLNPKDTTDGSDPEDAPRVRQRYPLEFGFHLTSAPPLPVFTPVKPTLLGEADAGWSSVKQPLSDLQPEIFTGRRDYLLGPKQQVAQTSPSLPTSQLAQLRTPAQHYLRFDGRYLRLFEGEQAIRDWPAVSGKENFGSSLYQDRANYGPIPEGTYDIKQSRYQDIQAESKWDRLIGPLGFGHWPGGTRGWGSKRVWADPTPETIANGLTFNRKGMAIWPAPCSDTSP
jgi:hypothetical protein